MYPFFRSYNLDLDPMTSIFEFDLDIPKTQPSTKTKFLGQEFQKLGHEQDRPTHTQTNETERSTTATFACGNINALWDIIGSSFLVVSSVPP